MINEVYWRNAARYLRLFGIDARVLYVLLPVLFHLRLWTIMLAMLAIIVFWFIERLGMPMEVALRAFYLQCITGKYRWGHLYSHRYLNQRNF